MPDNRSQVNYLCGRCTMKISKIIWSCVFLIGATVSGDAKASCIPTPVRPYNVPPLLNPDTPDKKAPVLVVSLDSGGVRGFIPQYVLAALEHYFGRHPTEMFDVFAGTSAGSIVTAFMNVKGSDGRPRFSAAKAVELSNQISKVVFKQPLWRKFRALGGIMGAKYSAKPMEDGLDAYLGNYKLSDTIRPVLITSFDYNRETLFDFTTKRAQQREDHNFLLSAAVRSSSAAPIYFKPSELSYCESTGAIRKLALADGAVGSYSPAQDAVRYARELYPDRQIILLSIGTGAPPKIKEVETRGWAAGGIPKVLMDFISGNFRAQQQRARQQIESQMCRIGSQEGCVAQEIRIEFQIPEEYSTLDDASTRNLNGLREIAKQITNLGAGGNFWNDSLRNANAEFRKAIDVLTEYYTPAVKSEVVPVRETIPSKGAWCTLEVNAFYSNNYKLLYTHAQRKLIETGFKSIDSLQRQDSNRVTITDKGGPKQYKVIEIKTPCDHPIRIRAQKNPIDFWTATVNFRNPNSFASLLVTTEGIFKKPRIRCGLMESDATCTDGITKK